MTVFFFPRASLSVNFSPPRWPGSVKSGAGSPTFSVSVLSATDVLPNATIEGPPLRDEANHTERARSMTLLHFRRLCRLGRAVRGRRGGAGGLGFPGNGNARVVRCLPRFLGGFFRCRFRLGRRRDDLVS